jgi:hypothetical protein
MWRCWATGTCCPSISAAASALLREHLEVQVHGASHIIGDMRNYKARGALSKAGYRLSADPQAVLRAYYAIPEDRLTSSVTYEKEV